MADVRRSRDAALGWCRKHPWHQQFPGVCSLCLGERLSRLSSSSSGEKTSFRRAPESSSSPSSVPVYYSLSCPMLSRRQRHGRLSDEAKSGPLLLSALFLSKLVNRRKKRRESDNNGLKRSGTTVSDKVTTT